MGARIHPVGRSSAEFGAGIAALRAEIANSMARMSAAEEHLANLEGKLQRKTNLLDHLIFKLQSLPAIRSSR